MEDKPGKIKINKDDYFFYSHLAKKLKPSPLDEVGLKCSLCKEEICPICMEVRDRPLICEECGDSFHNCCITNYTIQNNIGIPHIFRCPKCDILLQIEQDEIVQPFDGEKVSVHDYLEKGNTIKLSSIEEKQNPEIRETCVDKSLEATKFEYEKKESQPNYEENNTIRIGGFFGKVYTVKKEGNKLIYQKTDKHFSNDDDIKNKDALSAIEQQKTPGIKEKSQTWNPSINNNEHIKVKEKFLFTICPECGNRVNNQDKGITKCPNCGYKLNC